MNNILLRTKGVSWKLLIGLLIVLLPTSAMAKSNSPEIRAPYSKAPLGEVTIQGIGMNASMTGPSELEVGSTGTFRGEVVYDSEIYGIPLPFQYSFRMGFMNTSLTDHKVVSGNVDLDRYTSGDQVWFSSGNIVAWSSQVTKYASVKAKAASGYEGYRVKSVTNGYVGAFEEETAYVWTDITE